MNSTISSHTESERNLVFNIALKSFALLSDNENSINGGEIVTSSSVINADANADGLVV